MFRHPQRFNIQSRRFGLCLETQASALWSQRFTEIMASSFESSSQSLNLSQMKSDPCTFTGLDSSGHLNLMVMAYVDDLVIAGEAHVVQKFIHDIQDLRPQACGVPHSRSPSRVLGSDHQGQKVRANHDGVSAKAHRQSVRCFQSHRKVNHKDADDLKRRSNQMWQRHAFKIQDSHWQTLVDVASSFPSRSCQGHW